MIVAALTCVAFAMACSNDARAPDAPNVLLVTVDTLRADFVGAYAGDTQITPNLDALAVRSVTFERAVAASARTVPSHASILTSLWVREHSVGWENGWTRLGDERRLATAFAGAGYDTAAFVSNAVLLRRVGLDRGFDLYDDELPDAERNRPSFFERHAEGTTRRALAWLARERSQPWFLWVHYQDPHGPYTPPAAYGQLQVPALGSDAPLPALGTVRGEGGIPKYQIIGDERRPSQYLSRYAGEVRYFDHWLGKLLERAEKGSRDTVVLLTADHGESFGEEGHWFTHGYRTTPDQAHVPFLIHARGLTPERREELVHHVDVLPTLLELAGIPVPEDVRGIAIGSFLRSGSPFPQRIVFTDVGYEITAYRRDSFLRALSLEDDEPYRNFRGQAFRWEGDTSWSPREGDPVMRHRLERYASIEPDVEVADDPDEQTIERLRALGYHDPDED